MRGRSQGKRNDLLEKYEDYIKNLCQESDTDTDQQKESQKIRNDNRVNAKLGKIAGVSRDTISKFEAIKKIGSVKDILEIREGNREKSIIPVS